MFLTRSGKQSRGKEKREDTLTNERSHNALAQLSVSCQACKTKARHVAQASCLPKVFKELVQARGPNAPQARCPCYRADDDYEHEHEQEREHERKKSYD